MHQERWRHVRRLECEAGQQQRHDGPQGTFNTSAKEPNDDIGIVATLNSIPREVLAASFGIPVAAFADVPTDIKPVVITRRR